MNVLSRLTRSAIKRLPGGKEYLQMRCAKKQLFRSGAQSIFRKQGGNQSFDKIFLLLSAFYQNGLRGDILEFGVHTGFTARFFAEYLKRFQLNSARLHLFDSFEGLPKSSEEDAACYECVNGIWKQGFMKVSDKLPRLIERSLHKYLSKDRLYVVKGFFEKTLETHIQQTNLKKALLVNLDCDFHSSSKYVLRTLMEYDLIQDGTLLICDDWMSNFGNPNMGQRKAIHEILLHYPNWEFEKYFNYGLGSQVFVVHDLSVKQGRKLGRINENKSCHTH